jgi:hypothetical protein
MSIEIGTFEEYSMGANPSEEVDGGDGISIDPKIIENLVDLVGSEEEVEQAAKEAFEELKKSFDDNDIEIEKGEAPDLLAMSALVLKLVELGKLGPQEADSFIEENLIDMTSGENEESESEEEIKEDVNENEDILKNYKALAGFVKLLKEDMNDKMFAGGKNAPSIEDYGAFIELGIYYENLRDGITPKTLSIRGRASKKYVERDIMKYSGAQIKKLEKHGVGKTTIVR